MPNDEESWESSTAPSDTNQQKLDSTSSITNDHVSEMDPSHPSYICIEDKDHQETSSALEGVPIEVLNSVHVDKLTHELKKALGPCHNFVHGTCLLGNSCLYSHDPQILNKTDPTSSQTAKELETKNPGSKLPERPDPRDYPENHRPASRSSSKHSMEVDTNSNCSNNQNEQESKEDGECTESDQESDATVCLDEIRKIDSPNSSATICDDEYVDYLLAMDKSDKQNKSERGIFSGLYSEPESENNSSESDLDFTQTSTSSKTISSESAIAPTQSALANAPKVTSVNPRRPHRSGCASWKPAFREPAENTSLTRITGPTRTEMATWNQAYHYVEGKGQPRKAFSVRSLEEKPSMIPTIGSNRPERSTDYYDNRTT